MANLSLLQSLKLSIHRLTPVIITLVCGLLAIWFFYTSWDQLQYDEETHRVELSQDASIKLVSEDIQENFDQLKAVLAAPEIQMALATPETFSIAAERIAAHWANAEVVIIPFDKLDQLYATLPESGFGQLAAIEAALSTKNTVLRVVKDIKISAQAGQKITVLMFTAPVYFR